MTTKHTDPRAAIIAATRRTRGGWHSMPNKSGNVSCRTPGGFLITPSGVRVPGPRARAHRRIRRRRHARAAAGCGRPRNGGCTPQSMPAVRTSRRSCTRTVRIATALACAGLGIPAFHYMIALAGGAIRCVPYATFGTAELAAGAITGLEGTARRPARQSRRRGRGTVACGGAGRRGRSREPRDQYLALRAAGLEPDLLDDARTREGDREIHRLRTDRAGTAGMPATPGLADVRAAAGRIAPYVARTPVFTSRTLDERAGAHALLQVRELPAHRRLQGARRAQCRAVAARGVAVARRRDAFVRKSRGGAGARSPQCGHARVHRDARQCPEVQGRLGRAPGRRDRVLRADAAGARGLLCRDPGAHRRHAGPSLRRLAGDRRAGHGRAGTDRGNSRARRDRGARGRRRAARRHRDRGRGARRRGSWRRARRGRRCVSLVRHRHAPAADRRFTRSPTGCARRSASGRSKSCGSTFAASRPYPRTRSSRRCASCGKS